MPISRHRCFCTDSLYCVFLCCCCVRLAGSFQNPTSGLQRVENPSQGGLGANTRLKFERGQHCHAFGPRSAEVLLECGGENQLLEASEPSTCFYSFRMQSPVACNDEFARSIGLTPAAA